MEFQFHSVDPGFMQALGMEVLLGREFRDADNAAGAPVVMVNETFAERFWPGERPIGKLVTWSGGADAQVVGLVLDAMYRDLRDVDRPAFFIPLAQNPSAQLTLLARTSPGDADDLLRTMRGEVAEIDGRLPITTLQTMEELAARLLAAKDLEGDKLAEAIRATHVTTRRIAIRLMSERQRLRTSTRREV